MVEGLTHCEPDNPCRCQRVSPQGQCRWLGAHQQKGEWVCQIHYAGGRGDEKEKIRNYRLTKFQARVDDFVNNEAVKSLREEIGILRMTLEETMNQCKSSTELLLLSGKISDLVMKIEKIVMSCHKLEAQTGALLDKNAILQLGNILVEIISEYITDEDALTKISGQIISAIVSCQPSLD